MSSSRALCCLPSVKEQKHDFNLSVQCIIKQLLDSGFVISRIIEVSVRVINLSLRLQLITPTSTSIILDITKTSSNNCLQYRSFSCSRCWTGTSLQRRLMLGDIIKKRQEPSLGAYNSHNKPMQRHFYRPVYF